MRISDWSSDVCSSDLAAGERALAKPTVAAGLCKILVRVVRVGHGANRRHAIRTDIALLARGTADDHHAAITTGTLHISAGGAGELTPLAGLQLDIEDDGADRNLPALHRIARLHVHLLSRDLPIPGGARP